MGKVIRSYPWPALRLEACNSRVTHDRDNQSILARLTQMHWILHREAGATYSMCFPHGTRFITDIKQNDGAAAGAA